MTASSSLLNAAVRTCLLLTEYAQEQMDFCDVSGTRVTASRPPATREPPAWPLISIPSTRPGGWTYVTQPSPPAPTAPPPDFPPAPPPNQDFSFNWNQNSNSNSNENKIQGGVLQGAQNVGGILNPGHPPDTPPGHPSFSQVEVGYILGSWENQK